MRTGLRKTALACFAILGCLAAGCGGGGDEPALPDVPVSLTFTGELQGTMSTAINVHAHTDDDPMPEVTQVNGNFETPPLTKTQCANFTVNTGSIKDYLANVYGDVGGKKIGLVIEFDPDGAGYTSPGTSVDPESNSMSYDHASLRLPGEYEERDDVIGPGGPPQSMTLNADRRSGHIDAWFGLLGRSTKDDQNVGVIHVVGNWRCG